MSALTAELIAGVRPRPPRSSWPAVLAEVADRLVARYGLPRLGNHRDPVKEIFYILLSSQTADSQYRKTYRALAARFGTLDELAAGRVGDIRACIRSGGLANTKAVQIKRAARALLAGGGGRPASWLRRLPPAEAFRFLTRLPGVGPKSALCVMMYSLDADVFPVDVNVQRIAERLGAIPAGLKHYQAQRVLPRLVPPGRSRELHVAMVVHGRTLCLPRKPRCETCPIREFCRHARRMGETP